MISKHYLLDTSIILDDTQNIIFLWQDSQNKLFISDVVIEELDKKKDLQNETGFFAREFFRCINSDESQSFFYMHEDTFIRHVAKENNDFMQVIYFRFENFVIPLTLIFRQQYKLQRQEHSYNDSKLIEIARDYKLVLLTNDISLKTRCIAQGIPAQSLFRDRVENPNDIDFWAFFEQHKDAPLEHLQESKAFKDLTQWSLIQIDELDNTDSSLYKTGKKIFGLKVGKKFEELNLDEILKINQPYIMPINLEQKMLYALLTHPQNNLTIATGSTGSGKTLMALQAGITLVKNGVVDGIMYMRNTITANDKEAELGYRKGDENQKLGYFMYPLYSAINFTIDKLQEHSLAKCIEYRGDVSGIQKRDATEYFLQKHKIEIVDIAHARGISIGNKFVIFDEVQNASNATIKLIGTRIGEGSKIVFLGDWAQIDHPYLSKFRNGALSLLSKALKDDFIAGIQLRQTIRSDVASWFGANF
ncbi:phosphate starvation-inducible protein PhoH [Helicobacter jaachi]|uniref:Phosphate starvation-inducible protein PhoH n=1 Tax=Helicobacter jaachi TaxID=1677920 RepID=A0A4U8TA58_9HELI|nr:PhoH family protein [Helicobacter jaachi]TLD96563.1 phosphate starvation-inducible protein PhoH [Helicobacter jaachi]